MNVLISAWKYAVDGPVGRYQWERRNPLAASALRGAASLAFVLLALNIITYTFTQTFHFSNLKGLSCIFLLLTMLRYQSSPISRTNYLFEYACRYQWEQRNLLAASALRSAALVAWFTTFMCLLAYPVGLLTTLDIAWLGLPAAVFLAMTAVIYCRSRGKDGRKEPHPL